MHRLRQCWKAVKAQGKALGTAVEAPGEAVKVDLPFSHHQRLACRDLTLVRAGHRRLHCWQQFEVSRAIFCVDDGP